MDERVAALAKAAEAAASLYHSEMHADWRVVMPLVGAPEAELCDAYPCKDTREAIIAIRELRDALPNAPQSRWVKWPSAAKRHYLAEDGTKSVCGYDITREIGTNEPVSVNPPARWTANGPEPQGRWIADNPRKYCGICLRILGLSR